MNTQTRLKFGMVAFFTVVITAWAKNWFHSIDTGLMIVAATTVLGYMFVETKRPSNGNGNGK